MTDGNMENQVGSSGTSVPTPASGTPPATSAVSSEILHALDELIERKLQSGKDKRFAKIEGQLNNFESSLQRLKELQSKGFNEEQSLEIMRLQGETPAPVLEPPKNAPLASGRVEAAVTSVDDGLLRKLGLDPTDSEVVTALSDLSDGRKTLEKLAQLVNKPKPNQAQQMPVSGGSSAAVEDIGQLAAELQTLSKQPSKHWNRIEEIRRKLSEQTK